MTLSIIIPTLNSAQTLRECLNSISAQSLSRTQYEIILADAGSSDTTLAIARECQVDKIIENPLKTGEAGKAAGILAASGQYIALIDSDNILPDSQWLEKMLAPFFADEQIMASEPLAYTVRPQDPALTRYFALLGMNDPLCLFTRNYDRYCQITATWTGLNITQENQENYLILTLTEDSLPTIGANGFIFRRTLLEHVDWHPYFFDLDVVHQAVCAGCTRIAKVKTSIVHLYCVKLVDFARKQQRRIRDFLYFSRTQQRIYPWNKQKKSGVIRFCLATLLVLPLIFQMVRGFKRHPDRAWLYHLPVCWITLWIYGWAVFLNVLGRQQAPANRQTWQKP